MSDLRTTKPVPQTGTGTGAAERQAAAVCRYGNSCGGGCCGRR